MNSVSISQIGYYPRESTDFISETVELVRQRVMERDVQKVCVFTDQGVGALEAARAFENTNTNVFAVTFPANRHVRVTHNGDETVRRLGITDPDVEQQLRAANVEIVRGPLPFEEILIPRASDPKTAAIRHTLSLFGAGMQLCIQAILLLCDSGKVAAGEEIVSFSADTAILATASTSTLLFSPYEGMEIREIICKPRVHTLARFGLYQHDDDDRG